MRVLKKCLKISYLTEREANKELKKIKKNKSRGKVPIRSYYCQCGYYHLTSEQKR